MILTTDDFFRHDACERLETWSRQYELPRIPLAEALRSGLRAGLLSGDPQKAYSQFLAHSASPGLDIEGRSVYDVAVHHAALVEVISAYLLGNDGAWLEADSVEFGKNTFQPLSFQMADGRLRRVVLCSTWNALREQEERYSWNTVADMAATGRPMLVNVIVIGQSREGFRISPWTTGYEHPENRTLRIKRKEGKFAPSWRKVRREIMGTKPLDWLTLMQRDEAFEDVVYSFTADLKDRDEVLDEMKRMKMGGERMTRSSCFRYVPCPMACLCHRGLTPQAANWPQRNS